MIKKTRESITSDKKNNLPNGNGTQMYQSGGHYSGHFEADEKNGQGRYTSFINGRVFEGIWKNDKFNGKTVEELDGEMMEK